MADAGHSFNSSLREKVIEHLFVGDLLRHLWCNGIREIEVLRAEVDSGGYDLVLECNGVCRHVQLKASHRFAKTSEVGVNTKLSRKPDGCVVWVLFDPKTLELGPFLWFGRKKGEGLQDLRNYRVGRHTKANSEGVKAERPGIRVLKKAEFSPLATMADLAHALFGDCPTNTLSVPDYREKLERLAAFADRFRDPGVNMGTWLAPTGKGTPEQPFSPPYFSLSELGSEFLRMAYDVGWILEQFDWPNWVQGQEARNLLGDPTRLAEATPEELAKLLTVVLRQDRFDDGALEVQFQSGLLLRMAERAEVLFRGQLRTV